MIRNRSQRITPVVATALLLALAVPLPAAAVDPSTPVVIDGGGWGHGIGMPQYGMRGQAEEGWTYDQILAYWYDGTGLRQASEVVPAVPTTVRVGINYVDLGSYVEYRPFRWQDFHVEQDPGSSGVVTACLPGEAEGECSVTVDTGVTWRYQWSDAYFDGAGGCQFKRAGVIQYTHQTACDIRLYWTDQPNTRIAFPDVDIDRTFARGHIAFLAPVTVNNVRGFHFNVILDLDEYVLGLAEIPPSWHMEALKAQIVAARTYGAEKAKNGIRGDCSCHLVWSTFDQAYRGWHPLNEGADPPNGQRWYDAVMATAGQVVVYPAGGTGIAETYYASSTGGATEFVSDMWGSNQASYPYLVSKPDTWSEIYASTPTESTTIRWRHTRTAGEIVSALTESCDPNRPVPFPGLTELTDIEIVETHASGSPKAIEVTGVADGEITSKTFYHRADNCDERWGTIRSRLNLRGHFIYSFTGLTQPERLAGTNRYETAVAVSQSTHPGGSEVVYLAVGLNYPDALAGGPAAAAEGAPILLVEPDSLPGSTSAELQRLGPSSVVVLGGPAAISDSVLTAVGAVLPGAAIDRRQGPTRYETAVAVSSAVFAPGVGTVYIASGEDFADALIAAPAASVNGSPLLLVRSDGIPPAVAAELDRLEPSRIVVVGGASVVPQSIVDALVAYAPTVDRIAGGDRYAVAAAVSADAFPSGAGTVFVAVGADFPDALAGGPAAALDPGPLLLVATNSIPQVIKAELDRLGPSRIVILGGSAVVSEQVATELTAYIT